MIAPLQAVQIENFRGIRSAVLQLHPKVTVLFGSNAAGKTTVLDALAVGLGAIVARVPRSAGRSFGWTGNIRVPWKDRSDIGEKRQVERPYMRVEVVAAGGLRWDVMRLRSPQDRALAPESIGTRALHDTLDPLIREALDTPPGAVTRPIPLVAGYENERAVVGVPLRERDFKKEFHRFGGLDYSLSATTRFKTVFEWFRVMEDEERRERERRRNFSFVLPELEWVRRAVERAELRCRNPRVETRPIRMLVDFDHGNGELEPLDITSLSDGYRTHFSLVVDVARRMVQLNPSPNLSDPERGTNSEAIIFIDEIDLHLDPVWQARVVRGLLAAFPKAQFILTTHSEQVLGSVKAECVRRLSWGDGEILVERVPFAQGATGERILIELMGAPERVPGPVTDQLKRYTSLVEAGAGHSQEAMKLRGELENALQHDPLLHRSDLEMQRQALMEQFGRKPE
jgi:predicted ATP-binding protein involved in virulence